MKQLQAASNVNRKTITRSLRNISIGIALLIVLVMIPRISIAPFRAFGGTVWAANGLHYMNDTEKNELIEKINAPAETKLAEKIAKTTPSCDSTDEGFCEKSPGDYAYKSLVAAAVANKPAIPDKKEITGYCTLCVDGSFSPTCAVGRGACSHHWGVSAYNVAQYRVIPGSPEVPARPAIYSYSPTSYRESPVYIQPNTPSLRTIVNFAK